MKHDPQPRPLSIYVVAGEESRRRAGRGIGACARGAGWRSGEALRRRRAGDGGGESASPFPIDDSRSSGLTAIPRGLPTILRRIRETADAIVAAAPDAVVIIDSPDFTHRVARRVRRAAPTIPILDYVSPSVWAWRPWRAGPCASYVDCVLAILPFEPEAHVRLGGPPCVYVGHPLLERLGELRPNRMKPTRPTPIRRLCSYCRAAGRARSAGSWTFSVRDPPIARARWTDRAGVADGAAPACGCAGRSAVGP